MIFCKTGDGTYTERQKGIQTERQRDREAERQGGRWLTGTHVDRQAYR